MRPPMRLVDISTPAALVDEGRLHRNAKRMAHRAQAGGVMLRPHMKTAKCAEVARIATAEHGGGITVSTLAEAEFFFERGFPDLTYAVCMTPGRIAQAKDLAARGARLTLITDSVVMARALASASVDPPWPVLVEIDSGEHRTGVDAESSALLEIAHILHAGPGTRLAGVLTHGGHAYGADTRDQIRAIAEQERSAVVRAHDRLIDAGLPCSVVSAGSTPTAVHAPSFEGLTEIRPGVYVFFDLAQVGLGACSTDDIALSVLATVISHRPEHGRLVIDAGGLALSKDTSATRKLPDAGYGWLVDPVQQTRIGDLRVAVADQEHGYVEGTDIPFDRFPIGSQVRVLPNHACMTAAAYDELLIARDAHIVARWPRLVGWRAGFRS